LKGRCLVIRCDHVVLRQHVVHNEIPAKLVDWPVNVDTAEPENILLRGMALQGYYVFRHKGFYICSKRLSSETP
jgi:hypothetical protein